MVASRIVFVDDVAAERGLVVTSVDEHCCRLESPASEELAWLCDLDDGTPTADDKDPAAHVRWVCPELRTSGTPLLEVSRPGPHSDFGKLAKAFGRLVGREPQPEVEGRFAYTDPADLLDAGLRERIEHWPSAMHGDGVERPAELWAIKHNREGLVVESSSWWDSAPALEHQIALATDIADRLASRQ